MNSYSDDSSDAPSHSSRVSSGSSADEETIAHPHDIDWLKRFKGVRARVPEWWWNNCKGRKLYYASVISVHPERHHDGTYFQFRLDGDPPRITYFMNYQSLRRFVHKDDPHYTVIRSFIDPKPNSDVELDEEDSSSYDDDDSDDSSTSDLDESCHPEPLDRDDACPLDVRWLHSFIGFRINVPEYWWEGLKGTKKYPASIIAIDVVRGCDTTSYFQFETDEDRARNNERAFDDPSDRLTYFMNYDSVLKFQDRHQDCYADFDLPSTPRLNPRLTNEKQSGKLIHDFVSSSRPIMLTTHHVIRRRH